MLIGDAWPLASDLLARLRDVPGVTAAEAGGSMRRWRETVGDIDLVVAAKDRAALMDAFLTFPEIMRVLGRGETKASVELVSGLRAQLWVHPPKHFGTALQYATGSQAHNVRLRELARTKDLSLSEHAFTRPDGSQIHCKDEERVYKTLGLPWIPPELREDRGEIEAAVEGALPDLITPEQVVGDLQSHSTWSDGTASILEMAQAASEQGYEYLAITDHSRSLGVARGLTIERLKEQRQEIAEAQRILGEEFHLLHGTEVEVLADGSLDFPDDVLAELDIVVASIHSSLRQPRERITERMLAAIRNPHVDVIGHPSGRIIGRRDPADLDMERVFQAGAEAGIALEINARSEGCPCSPCDGAGLPAVDQHRCPPAGALRRSYLRRGCGSQSLADGRERDQHMALGAPATLAEGEGLIHRGTKPRCAARVSSFGRQEWDADRRSNV
jgi:DNA polymerase (family 10)